MTAPPFGAFPPTRAEDHFRRIAHSLPANYWGRRAASLLLGPAGGRSDRAFDVRVFGTERARLHPGDNISEKRVYLTPQLWEPTERRALRDAIDAHERQDFYFADIGANAGLYTLFAQSCARSARRTLRATCVEADPEMHERLAFNIAASGAEGQTAIFRCAAAGETGRAAFEINRKSRGLSRLSAAGTVEVATRTIASLLEESKRPRLDAMKIDIEGSEHEALDAFFAEAALRLWPRLLILETSHDVAGRSGEALAARHGYAIRRRTKRNTVMTRINNNS